MMGVPMAITIRPIMANPLEKYMPKVLRRVHPTFTLTKEASQHAAAILTDITRRVATEAVAIAQRNGRKILYHRDLEAAMILVAPGNLIDAAMRAGKAVVTAMTFIRGKCEEPASKGLTAALDNLVLHRKVVKQILNKYLKRVHTDTRALGYWAGALEEIAKRVLEAAGSATNNRGKTRVQVIDITAEIGLVV